MDALSTNRTWQPSRSHGTYQHKTITSRSRQLVMMGTWLPETCWATIRREIKNTKVTSSWFLLSTLSFIEIRNPNIPFLKLFIVNPLNAELNPICHFLALLGAHHILHVSRIRVKYLCIDLWLHFEYICLFFWEWNFKKSHYQRRYGTSQLCGKSIEWVWIWIFYLLPETKH